MSVISVFTLHHTETAPSLESRLLASESPQDVAAKLGDLIFGMAGGMYTSKLDIQIGEGDAVAASGTVLFSSAGSAGDSILINGVTLTAVAGAPGANQWQVGANAAASAANFAAAVNASVSPLIEQHVSASDNGAGLVTLLALNKGASGNAITLSEGVDAGGFAVLAASAITNTGASVINGDLGIFPGSAVTGFPPGVVNGVQHITDAAAQAAQVAALASYTAKNALVSTTIPSVLDGQVLTPGVYDDDGAGTFNLAASGNATLTLNGAGTYVFQAGSTLVTGAGGIPTISLTNGALAKDVYWIVGSSATLNSGFAGVFQGNVIADQSITVTLGGTVNGNLAALNAAITFSAASTVNSSGGNMSVSGARLSSGADASENMYHYGLA